MEDPYALMEFARQTNQGAQLAAMLVSLAAIVILVFWKRNKN